MTGGKGISDGESPETTIVGLVFYIDQECVLSRKTFGHDVLQSSGVDTAMFCKKNVKLKKWLKLSTEHP